VIERRGRFLVVKEHVARRVVFNQPAGHVEAGETLLQAVVREVREETAWNFTPRFFLGAYSWREPRHGRSFLRCAFCGDVSGHDPQQPLDRGIVSTHWLSAARLRSEVARLRSPLVLRCLEDYLGGARQDLAAVAALDRDQARGLPALRV
jgi:8-oxo-dGTP pyrophosphatase MutT (NUDIX family)